MGTCTSGARRSALPAERRATGAALQVPGSSVRSAIKAAASATCPRHGVRAHLTALTATRRSASIVPIVPDEARTFGMEGMFRQLGIYASQGQLYEPVDSAEIMQYREDKKGQILEEGINEAGSTASFIAAGTSYANYGIHMVPFYAFYSMFGFARRRTSGRRRHAATALLSVRRRAHTLTGGACAPDGHSHASRPGPLRASVRPDVS